MAAGGDVAQFWKYWYYHYHSPKVVAALEKTRIGSLTPEHSTTDDGHDEDDPYRSDPSRDRSKHFQWLAKPFNSETRREVLSASYLTPTDALYIRNHAPVPHIEDAQGHRVAFVDGERQVTSASVSELAGRFAHTTITSVLQCAGNRAADDAKSSGPNGFHGTPFERLGCGMVGNVQWSGVRLSELLPAMFPQLRAGSTEGLHVVFEGADGYESSTPARLVLAESGDGLLATHMNGERLAADHGFPCRALLPGIAGARSVKWLTQIRLSDSPAEAPWNANYYRRADGSEVQALPPLQSIILRPTPNERVVAGPDQKLTVHGVAYNGAGGGPVRAVEVSSDDGESWHTATLLNEEVLPDDARTPKHWLRWRVQVPIRGDHAQLCCRAVDANGHSQPRVSQQHRGYLYNGWSRVDVDVAPPALSA